jgi:hypothetical protein
LFSTEKLQFDGLAISWIPDDLTLTIRTGRRLGEHGDLAVHPRSVSGFRPQLSQLTIVAVRELTAELLVPFGSFWILLLF